MAGLAQSCAIAQAGRAYGMEAAEAQNAVAAAMSTASALDLEHFMDRVAATHQNVASRDVTPDLAETDRALLANTLRDLRESIVNQRAAEQVLHGEPHPWNVLNTKTGPLFMDLEDAVHGAATTTVRVADNQGWHSSTRCERVRPGVRSTPCSAQTEQLAVCCF